MRARIPLFAGALLLGPSCGLILDSDPPDPTGGGNLPDGGPLPLHDAGSRDAPLPPPADGDVLPDVPIAPDAGPPDLLCGGPSDVQDHFADGADSPWARAEHGAGAMVEEIPGGTLRLSLPTAGPVEAGYISKRWYDAREDGTAVIATGPADLPTNAEQVFALAHGEGDYVAIVRQRDSIRFSMIQSGHAPMETAPMAYDPVRHRWWSLRGEGGQVVAEVSPDGVLWERLVELPAPTWLEAVQIALAARSRASLDMPVAVEFDDLGRQPGAMPQPPCPIDSFRDDFEGRISPNRWQVLISDDGACELGFEPTGSLSIRPNFGRCALETRHLYDATDRAATIEIAGAPMGEHTWSFSLQRTGGAAVTASCTGEGGLLAEDPGTMGKIATFACAPHRFWRLRHAGDVWQVEVSDDGGAYLTLASVTASIDPSRVFAVLAAEASFTGSTDVPLLLSTYNP